MNNIEMWLVIIIGGGALLLAIVAFYQGCIKPKKPIGQFFLEVVIWGFVFKLLGIGRKK